MDSLLSHVSFGVDDVTAGGRFTTLLQPLGASRIMEEAVRSPGTQVSEF